MYVEDSATMKTRSSSTFDALPDDVFQLFIAACGGDYADVPLLEDVKGLWCLSKALLQQLHRLRPLVGVKSFAVVQRPAHGPWRVVLLRRGKLTAAVARQARQGRVRSIDSSRLGNPNPNPNPSPDPDPNH